MIPIQVPQNGPIERNTRRNLQKEVEMFLDLHPAKNPRGQGLAIKERKRKSRDAGQDLAAGNAGQDRVAESEEGHDLVTGSQVDHDLENGGVARCQENDEGQDLVNESQVARDLVKGDNLGLDLTSGPDLATSR